MLLNYSQYKNINKFCLKNMLSGALTYIMVVLSGVTMTVHKVFNCCTTLTYMCNKKILVNIVIQSNLYGKQLLVRCVFQQKGFDSLLNILHFLKQLCCPPPPHPPPLLSHQPMPPPPPPPSLKTSPAVNMAEILLTGMLYFHIYRQRSC